MFETVIVGNVDTCRTEAEIADETGARVAIVYEDLDGWHTELVDRRAELSISDFNVLVENAKEVLSHYVNRRGENVPDEITSGALSLWLMLKDDGTAMGRKL
ncbi:MAG: hypothetical protein WA817_04935 [Candidatus Acidiferrum sp.]